MSHIFSAELAVLRATEPPFGMQVSGGSTNRPEVVYPEEDWAWPDLSKPLSTIVRVENGTYIPEQSKPEFVYGAVGEFRTDGIKITSDAEKLNGFYVNACDQYVLSNAEIVLSGIGEDDFAGIGAAVLADGKSALTIKDSTIVTTGASRPCTSATKTSTMKVINCKLIANGGPLPEDYVPVIGPGMLEPPKALDIGGTCRAHLSMDNSKAYFYDTTITADGWAALSTDAALGYVYLEANNCDLEVKNAGYGVYSDGDCHVVLNDCRIKTATHTAIMAGWCDLALNNVTAKSGHYGAMIHCVMGVPTEVAELTIRGGSYEVGEEFLLLRSTNTYIDMIGTKIKSKNGILVRSIINPDECTTKVGSDPVFGNNIVMTAMDVEGDILHEDTERTMSVTLACTTLRGKITDTYLTLDSASRWIATGDSTVVLVGDVRASQMDAPADVTITAGAGEGCNLNGTYTLTNGGKLVVATAE